MECNTSLSKNVRKIIIYFWSKNGTIAAVNRLFVTCCLLHSLNLETFAETISRRHNKSLKDVRSFSNVLKLSTSNKLTGSEILLNVS